MRKTTKELALCGVLTALAIVLLCLGGMIPFALYACPILASAVLLPIREECRRSYAWCCWLAIAILGALLGPDKEAAALFCFLGYYPLLKPRLDGIRNPAARLAVKLGLAAVAIGTMYAVLLYVIGLTAVVEEFAHTAPWMLWVTAALGVAVFLVYDILLARFTAIYRRKRRK